MKRTQAFTLVELLMVIAIISVLAAMLLPSLQNALATARKVDCANRMRQMMFWVGNYETDNADKHLPARIFVRTWSTPNYGNYGWQQMWWAGIVNSGYYGHDIPEIWGTWNPYASGKPYCYADYVNRQTRAMSLFACPAGVYEGCPESAYNGSYTTAAYLHNGPALSGWSQDFADKRDTFTEDGVALQVKPTFPMNGFGYRTLLGYQVNGLTSTWGYFSAPGDTWKTWYYPYNTTYQHKPPSTSLYFIETSQRRANVNLDDAARFRQEGAKMVTGNGSDRNFRVPHADTANFSCRDGHVGTLSRDAFFDAAASSWAIINKPGNSVLPFNF